MCSDSNNKECAGIIGKRVRIISMDGEPAYSGRTGIVTGVDSKGQIHGTWGGCALVPGIDKWTIEETDR